ncbi:MAG TPA: hypothetical protein VMY16_10580 [Ilumatobacteraceae bacterium]|nr:hypothetical protein [Ilumatobacteraceae bacterium]
MPQRRLAALVLVLVVATLAACGSSNDTDTKSTSATVESGAVAVGDAPAPPAAPASGDDVGSIGDAVDVAAGAPGEAEATACTIDRQTLESAVETYELLEGAVPSSQQELLDAQMIGEQSVRYDISADGVVVPAPGSICV